MHKFIIRITYYEFIIVQSIIKVNVAMFTKKRGAFVQNALAALS